jgi:hypothetical protein
METLSDTLKLSIKTEIITNYVNKTGIGERLHHGAEQGKDDR